ncbi:CHASE2 domain-containing sensor protein [Rufibacter quisquiliarum]|uniref:CHASE2 domain-containing sensor protein n=1 Tax=Rufibacter quisquiliarum TaxID=1549639 RepID=A0A839GQ72_9BACT|nr:CHASE2 domain-containing sensor protein [Rufibacter quisquiliarum]
MGAADLLGLALLGIITFAFIRSGLFMLQMISPAFFWVLGAGVLIFFLGWWSLPAIGILVFGTKMIRRA